MQNFDLICAQDMDHDYDRIYVVITGEDRFSQIRHVIARSAYKSMEEYAMRSLYDALKSEVHANVKQDLESIQMRSGNPLSVKQSYLVEDGRLKGI